MVNCQYYGHQRTRKVALFVTAAVVLLSAILELALVLAVRPIKNDHTKDMILQFCGIFASILIAVALFPQYWEIYKLKAVIGISLVFISIDILGGVFNDLSLVFKEEFDVIAACQYTVVVVLDSVIILAAGFFKVKDWRNRGSISARDDKTQQQTCRVEDLHSRTLSTADTTLSVSRLPSFHQAEVQVGDPALSEAGGKAEARRDSEGDRKEGASNGPVTGNSREKTRRVERAKDLVLAAHGPTAILELETRNDYGKNDNERSSGNPEQVTSPPPTSTGTVNANRKVRGRGCDASMGPEGLKARNMSL
ncbi:PQ loop repeat protein [Coprinopsis cinerea okayama7|uniref:PQ loop repeat protein n=1 Tax=Coprinopsis cinerea (strain Okayama-7 / 130 / ATCC MYA-4618 / FGSC 9003) TaxID=240176 RepID=A8N9A7_COPC7|nr:PQ loop repeat protein [Coprinopsis cinerea okayama7\|eukprot:XP_001831435.2 PQ loop repeat protein [Coprinopsis cinerea okayama7\